MAARPHRVCCAAPWPTCLRRPGTGGGNARRRGLFRRATGPRRYGGCGPASPVRHARYMMLRLPLGRSLLPEILTRLQTCPNSPDLYLLSSGSPSSPLPASPDPQKGRKPRTRRVSRGSSIPLARILGHQDHLSRRQSTHHPIRGIRSYAVRTSKPSRCLGRLLAVRAMRCQRDG